MIEQGLNSNEPDDVPDGKEGLAELAVRLQSQARESSTPIVAIHANWKLSITPEGEIRGEKSR